MLPYGVGNVLTLQCGTGSLVNYVMHQRNPDRTLKLLEQGQLPSSQTELATVGDRPGAGVEFFLYNSHSSGLLCTIGWLSATGGTERELLKFTMPAGSMAIMDEEGFRLVDSGGTTLTGAGGTFGASTLTGDLTVNDNVKIKIGTDSDLTVDWDGTQIDVLLLTDNTPIRVGNGTADADLTWYLGTTSLGFSLDASAAYAKLEDMCYLGFGTNGGFGPGNVGDVCMFWSTADASDHGFVLALGDTSQMFHITDVGAQASDWNITSPTHPNIYIHSNTTPITDYLRVGGHDGTTADIDVVGGTTLAFKIAGVVQANLTAGGLDLIDDNSAVFGTGLDAEMFWSTGDASDHGLVLALGDTSQMLHVTDVGAKASDWNITSPTHPNVYIHSNTTPITDYLRLGDHDGTEADIDCVGGTSIALKLAGTEYASVRVTGLASGAYVAAATPGTDQLTMKSTGTAPASTGANVGHLYADFETDDDELFWLSGTNGTATQLTT